MLDVHAMSAAAKVWGHRVCTPSQTLDKLRPHLAGMGITRLADVTDLDAIGIPVAQAIRPMGRSLSVSQGKGVSLDAALASAAMESAEGWHAEFVELDSVQASPLGVADAIRLDLIVADLAALGDGLVTFLPGVDLISGRERLVPFDMVSKDYTQPAQVSALPRSTNGLASGNTLEEAVASALHEVIERDAYADFAIHPENARARRMLDIGAVARASAAAAQLIERIASAGLTLLLYDVTNDLAVPTVRAALFETGGALHRPGAPVARPDFGTGCHLDPTTAIVRAITEAAQSRLTRIAGSRDDLTDRHYQTSKDGNFAALLEYTGFAGSPSELDLSANESTRTTSGDIARLLEKLLARGVEEAVRVDLSRPGMPIHVVRIIVPGLGYNRSGRAVRGLRHKRIPR